MSIGIFVLISIKFIRSIIINTSKLKYSSISILSKHSSIVLIFTFSRSININHIISISISYTIGIIIKLINSFSTPNIIFNINYSSSSNKFNNSIGSFDTICFTMNSISYNINSSYTKSFISFSKSFFDSKTAFNSSFFISLRLNILTRSINNSINNFIYKIILTTYNMLIKSILRHRPVYWLVHSQRTICSPSDPSSTLNFNHYSNQNHQQHVF